MAFADRLKDFYQRFRQMVFIVGGVGIFVWFLWFDSYNLISRIELHREKNALQTDNAQKRLEIETLTARLERGLTNADVERIAREQYAMSRPGETVYPIERK